MAMSNVVLRALVDDAELCRITLPELPAEKMPVRQIARGSTFTLEDSLGHRYRHALAHEEGWFHFSIRVHERLSAQADCVVTESPDEPPPTAFQSGKARGIRFSPIYLPGNKDDPSALHGRSLFFRGLHFPGAASRGNLSLSCICDACERSFRLQSFHAGFANCGYFYSDSGLETLIVDGNLPGCPPARGKPDLPALAALEATLPLAKDGTRFRYVNSLRCPRCRAPYIDFEKFPEQRENEYYGNYFYGEEPMRFTGR